MKNVEFVYDRVREIDLINYLFSLGFRFQKIANDGNWHLSPLREKRQASFEVNRRLNIWYYQGACEGSFGVSYHDINILELSRKLKPGYLSFRPHLFLSEMPSDTGEKEIIRDVNERKIVSQKLNAYLREKRQVSLVIARRFCQEIDFILCDKKSNAAGLKNCGGRCGLSNENFKQSSSKQDLALIKNKCSNRCSSFERFFNFFSFQLLLKKDKKILSQLSNEQASFLNFNSSSFSEKSPELTEKYASIYLYFDRDKARSPTIYEVLISYAECSDKSTFYEFSNGLNDYPRKWCQQRELRKSNRFRMRF